MRKGYKLEKRKINGEEIFDEFFQTITGAFFKRNIRKKGPWISPEAFVV